MPFTNSTGQSVPDAQVAALRAGLTAEFERQGLAPPNEQILNTWTDYGSRGAGYEWFIPAFGPFPPKATSMAATLPGQVQTPNGLGWLAQPPKPDKEGVPGQTVDVWRNQWGWDVAWVAPNGATGAGIWRATQPAAAPAVQSPPPGVVLPADAAPPPVVFLTDPPGGGDALADSPVLAFGLGIGLGWLLTGGGTGRLTRRRGR